MDAALEGERLDRALAASVDGLSRGRARQAIAMGGVYVGQRVVRVASRKVRGGDHVTVTWTGGSVPLSDHILRVVHLDEHVVVVAKPAGQHTQATALGDQGTLTALLAAEVDPEARLVHRMDAPASGLLVAGRGKRATEALASQVRAHHMVRRYVAVTSGVPPDGLCDLPLLKERGRVRVATADEPKAQAARTEVRVVRTHGPRAFVEASLQTGRTHQVRVHLAGLGAPIVGDTTYGGVAAPRLCLHGAHLAFRHPAGGSPMVFDEAPDQAFWDAARIPDGA